MSGAGSAEEPGIVQRPDQGCVERSRRLGDPNLPRSVPTGVQSSLLHLRSSWKGFSPRFGDELRVIDNARRAGAP
jgi:hypothetical protein